MKTKLLIIYLFFFTSQVFAADCRDDYDWEWVYSSSRHQSQIVWDKKNAPYIYMFATFRNKSKNAIIIKNMQLLTNDGSSAVMAESSSEHRLGPFGKLTASMSVGNLNLDVAGAGRVSCHYEKIN